MINNAKIDDAALESFEELLTMGFAAAADTCSKLFNSEVSLNANQINYEKIDGLATFGEEPGVIISLNLAGALNGKAAIAVQNFYAKNILNILMNIENDDEEEEIDEMAMGAFKELIGQMSSAFAGALSDFFGSVVTIEAVDIFDLSEECEELAEIFGTTIDTEVYSIVTNFEIKDHIDGTFNLEVNVETFNYTVDRLNMIPGSEDESVFLNAIAGGNDPMNLNAFSQGRTVGRASSVVKDSINVQSAQFPSFAGQSGMGGLALLQGNMDLLMDVPLNVTIEIGKTRKKMRDIMEFAQGTVIDLEKQAGAPVDIVVNGQLIARGDVVVIDDNFGVRITEIVSNNAFIPKE